MALLQISRSIGNCGVWGMRGISTSGQLADVLAVSSDKDFKDKIGKLGAEDTAVVQFTAAWCGPCKFIAPHLEQLSKQYPKVKFYKVDIDVQPLNRTVQDHNVTGVPMFALYKGPKRVESFMGARVDYLKDVVAKYAGK